ncbi:ABC transporter ATP-binding protein [Amycolatopsis alkalitolerans]|uniref:ABC transporter ATP-binding protein n=2 Tax=Amycolatopsis alkalitolerans TaxID=2547244 RepID=A0A5C4M154_9PSEU|nr:ABC transporter ATP-binding protein [Amycolatopsis alkalitolerans]
MLVNVQDLRKVYRAPGTFGPGAEFVAVQGASFTVGRGESFGLIGESGSGKTTIGRMLLRLLEPTSGYVEFDGYDVLSLAKPQLRALRRRMQIVFQDSGSAFNPRLSVGDQVAYPMRRFGLHPRGEIKARVIELLEKVGLRPEQAQRYPHEFSGGQRQRLGIARALAAQPDFVVLDEPTSALDVSVQGQILALLKEIQAERGLTLVLISHNLAVIQHMCDRAAVLHHGEIAEQGPVGELFGAPRSEITRQLLDAVLEPVLS